MIIFCNVGIMSGFYFLMCEFFFTPKSSAILTLHLGKKKYWVYKYIIRASEGEKLQGFWNKSCIIVAFSRHLKAMAPHSSTLAWKIPWTEKPGRLQSMGLLRVGHDWATSLSLFTFLHWRRKWQPTPVFLPGESQGQRSLVGCRLWGRTESDTTEAT